MSRYKNLRRVAQTTGESSESDQPLEVVIPEGANVLYLHGKKRILRKENFEQSNETDQVWFERMYSDFQRRQAQKIFAQDYSDVPFWEYEFLVKVGTEYYFRYEGTQLVPPCFEEVHWRLFKDPIRINKRQTAELNRLLAWRISPTGSNKCVMDSAGRRRPSENRIKLDRDLQYYHLQHRMTFCECKDWPSKFEADREWCDGWRDDPGTIRFYDRPYNFDTGGKF